MASRGNHLSTGFLGTPFLLNVLQDGGRGDLAHKILVRTPTRAGSYMLSRGGTTIWERWDGIRPDGSLQDAGMNSFNHYGLGSIGDWLYDVVGGLRPRRAGYKKILVAPSTGELPQRVLEGQDALRRRADRMVQGRPGPPDDRRRRPGQRARRGARADQATARRCSRAASPRASSRA